VGGRIRVYRPFLWVHIGYIGLGQRYFTNPHNQRLMEIKPISIAMVVPWVRSEAPYAGAASLDKEEPRTP